MTRAKKDAVELTAALDPLAGDDADRLISPTLFERVAAAVEDSRASESLAFRRNLQPKWQRAIIAVALVAVGAVFGSFAGGVSANDPQADPAALERFSAEGQISAIGDANRRLLDDPPGLLAGTQPKLTGRAFVLAERAGHRFYRLETPGNRICMAIAPIAGSGSFDTLSCPRGFPSAEVPLFDRSVVQADKESGVRMLRVEGFAADGVTSVGVVDAAGRLVAETPVDENVYAFAIVPLGGELSELVAFDAYHNEVHRTRLGR